MVLVSPASEPQNSESQTVSPKTVSPKTVSPKISESPNSESPKGHWIRWFRANIIPQCPKPREKHECKKALDPPWFTPAVCVRQRKHKRVVITCLRTLVFRASSIKTPRFLVSFDVFWCPLTSLTSFDVFWRLLMSFGCPVCCVCFGVLCAEVGAPVCCVCVLCYGAACLLRDPVKMRVSFGVAIACLRTLVFAHGFDDDEKLTAIQSNPLSLSHLCLRVCLFCKFVLAFILQYDGEFGLKGDTTQPTLSCRQSWEVV